MADVRLIDANALLDKNNWTIKQYSEEEANAWRDGIALMKKNIETLQPSTRKRCGLWRTGKRAFASTMPFGCARTASFLVKR